MKERTCIVDKIAIVALILLFVTFNGWGIWGAIGLLIVVPLGLSY